MERTFQVYVCVSEVHCMVLTPWLMKQGLLIQGVPKLVIRLHYCTVCQDILFVFLVIAAVNSGRETRQETLCQTGTIWV